MIRALLALAIVLPLVFIGCQKKEHPQLPQIFERAGVQLKQASDKRTKTKPEKTNTQKKQTKSAIQRVDWQNILDVSQKYAVRLVPLHRQDELVLLPATPTHTEQIERIKGFSATTIGVGWGVCAADRCSDVALADNKAQVIQTAKTGLPGLALWRVQNSSLKPFEFVDVNLKVGKKVFVVSVARGFAEVFPVRIVSKAEFFGKKFSDCWRVWQNPPYEAASAPAFDENGTFVGVITFVLDPVRNEQIAVLVSAKRLALIDAKRYFTESLDVQTENKQQPQKAWLGITLEELTDQTRKALQLDDDVNGLVVKKVIAASPADKAGVVPGDVIISINGKSLDGTAKQAKSIINTVHVGDTVVLQIVRNGQTKNINVKAAAKP